MADTLDQVIINANPDKTVKYAAFSRIRTIAGNPPVVVAVPFAPVEATGEWSLPNILGTLQAATVTTNSALTADLVAAKKAKDDAIAEKESTIAAKQAELDAANTTITALRQQLKDLEPKKPTPIKFVRIALDKLDAAKPWAVAVEATITTLETAGDKDPKRIYRLWYEGSAIDTIGDDWALIVSLIEWPKEVTEAALLALISQIGGTEADVPAEAAPAVKARVAPPAVEPPAVEPPAAEPPVGNPTWWRRWASKAGLRS